MQHVLDTAHSAAVLQCGGFFRVLPSAKTRHDGDQAMTAHANAFTRCRGVMQFLVIPKSLEEYT
ncbi:hypothetical protein [Paraburkholderia sp. 2C]|jgi:hypothetical protein